MSRFQPHWDVLPLPQRQFWPQFSALPPHFVLYGGTALALRLGHRQSLDFDFFSAVSFQPEALREALPFISDAEVVQQSVNTLTIRTPEPTSIRLSFFGGLTFGQFEPADLSPEAAVPVAGLKDLLATKLNTVYQRAEAKDYLDIDAMLQGGDTLSNGLGYARAIYGSRFNPMLPLKALTFFDDGDLPQLPPAVKQRLSSAVQSVTDIPQFQPYSDRIRGRE